VSDAVIDGWKETQLRQYLLENGIISPASTQEQLVLMAKNKASQLSSAVRKPTPAASHVSTAANSAASYASGVASYMARRLDDAQDYVFSSWPDEDLTSWLKAHNALPDPPPSSRGGLLDHVRDAYSKITSPAYSAWSNSYLHEWLTTHGVIPPPKSEREKLLELMDQNYYDLKDSVYSTWEDTDLRNWLVKEGVL
jgi:hypothetical protein